MEVADSTPSTSTAPLVGHHEAPAVEPLQALPLAQAWAHIEQIAHQSLETTGISKTADGMELWPDLLMKAMHDLEAYVTPERLEALAEAAAAMFEVLEGARRAAATTAAKAKGGGKDKVSKKADDERKKVDGERRKESKILPSKPKEDELRAATPIPTPPTAPDSDAKPRPLRARSEVRSEAANTLLRLATSCDVVTGQEHEPLRQRRLTRFRLFVAVTETTPSAIKCGTQKKELRFVPDEVSEGVPLFGEACEKEADAEEALVETIGGTFHLTITHKEAKLPRILELLAFATLSLVLETHLLHDFQCPRAPLPLDDESDTESEAEVVRSGEKRWTHIPEEPNAPTRAAHHHKTSSSKWSNMSLWNFLLGSNSSVPSPRRAILSPSSPSPSHGPVMKGKDLRKHFQKKIKLGGGLRMRKSQRRREVSNTSEASTVTSDGSAVLEEQDDLDSGWDLVGGLGLGFGVLSRKHDDGDQARKSREESDRASAKEKEEELEEQTDKFAKVIRKMEKAILSVSPDVRYPPPHLLVRLRKQELDAATTVTVDNSPVRPPVNRLNSYPTLDVQTLALGFANGGAGDFADSLGRGSVISATTSTTSRTSRITIDAKAGLASLMTNNNSLSGTIRHQSMRFLAERKCLTSETPCEPPSWKLYRFYGLGNPIDGDGEPDISLCQLVERLAQDASEVCPVAGCGRPGHEHVLSWMHSEDRITASVSIEATSLPVAPAGQPGRPSPITMWSSCMVCGRETTRLVLSQATYLFSFAKFTELMLYDPNFVVSFDFCDHALESRTSLVRHFAVGSTVVKFTLDRIELFELRLPTAVDPDSEPAGAPSSPKTSVADLTVLHDEIESFYRSAIARVEAIAHAAEDLEGELATPTDSTSSKTRTAEEEDAVEHLKEASDQTVLGAGRSSAARGAGGLRSLFYNEEGDLLNRSRRDDAGLNALRRDFKQRANACRSRLSAWQKKHLPSDFDEASLPEVIVPDYLSSNVHVVPIRSSVLVRDDEPSSAIALALSADEFKDQVSAALSFSSAPPDAADARHHHAQRQPIPSEFLAAPKSLSSSRRSSPPRSPRLGSSPAKLALDPDDLSADYATPDELSYKVTVKKAPRGSAILTLRNLTRQKSQDTGFTLFGLRTPVMSPALVDDKEGESIFDLQASLPTTDDSLLDELIQTSKETSPPLPPSSPRTPSVISTLTKRHVSDATPTAALSLETAASSTSGQLSSASSTLRSVSSLASLDTASARTKQWDDSLLSADTSSGKGGSGTLKAAKEKDESDSASFASVLTPEPSPGIPDEGGESDMLAPLQPSRLPFGGFLNSSARKGRSVSAQTPRSTGKADQSGHVKFSFRENGKQVRVTAWYAQKFEKLRKRCGLSEELYIKSLSRCQPLAMTGGKSAASFLVTGDERFVMKQLVSTWGVDEKEAFMNFAPDLLNYLSNPERPSLICKIFGFYTIKHKVLDVKTKDVQKTTWVVMENLNFGRSITRQYDLKGVASRIAKQKAEDAGKATGWDGDWLKGSLNSRLMLYAHSKTLLRTAIQNDVAFLSGAGSVDYSLLVGVDDHRKELVVGLIDTLGVFNLAKLLENKGKTAFKQVISGDPDSVTVIPPAEYGARLSQAIERYFLAVPEVWSRPQGQKDVFQHDPRLASVL